ncbi:glycosyl hydrolase family 18 protein [Paenibacillus roseipurpureus]|uniref:Glycosyl hydrolase family 18 protein n=1 Tax=Paenibacillus roseopurpureus TaxID=2918901 RepID=A0AA96RKB9_9BACL|nr:glycosyl hydrolase family 18 protein [Paenibacillus sp. MBLB1832]WNR44194.1 glycosyl hydrolase family 18 protein [Paenibacillus sp. MBLB1832]
MRRLILISLLLLFIVETVSSSETKKINISYLYFGSPSSYLNQIDLTKNTLTAVSPNYLDIVANGELEITWKLDTSFISEMHRRGIKVVPFLSNHWDKPNGIAAVDQNAEKITTDIAAAVSKYGFDGINVDIEGVGDAYRAKFTTFVQKIRAKIPAGKEVSVAVAANPQGWTTGWQGFYDYNELAKTSNYLMVMSYDESYDGGPSGPVASIDFFEKSLTYTINQGVPKSKIVMGVPFYGRIWKLDGPTLNGDNVQGLGVSNNKVAGILQKFGASESYDKVKQSPYCNITIPAGQSTFVASTELTAGNYMLWYENETSIKQKILVSNQYGVAGNGSWSLYQETPATWDYFARWQNGTYFADVSRTYWALDPIMFVSSKNWMTGNSTTFSPEQNLSRAQAATILVRALELTPKGSTNPFIDTKGHWAEADIRNAYSNGIVDGLDASHFKPNDPLTREQLSALLKRALQISDSSTNSPFTDVPKASWSYSAIISLYANGLIDGLTPTTFGPTKTSTRAQMAAMMARLAPRIDEKVAAP